MEQIMNMDYLGYHVVCGKEGDVVQNYTAPKM